MRIVALHAIALHGAVGRGQRDCAKTLVALGADPNRPRWSDGMTPLHAAAYLGHAEITAMLLDAGADQTVEMTKGPVARMTPLIVSAVRGHREVAEVLLRRPDCPIDVTDAGKRGGWGATALQHAVARGHGEVVSALVAAGADVNARPDEASRSALYLAVVSGDHGITKTLCRGGADPNLPTRKGTYPIHEASYRGDVNGLDILQAFGADRHVVDGAGYTASQLGELGGDRDAAKWLRATEGWGRCHFVAVSGEHHYGRALLRAGTLDPVSHMAPGIPPVRLVAAKSCGYTQSLFADAMKPWAPVRSLHWMHGPTFRAVVSTAMLLEIRSRECGTMDLPYLPRMVWLLICRSMRRSDHREQSASWDKTSLVVLSPSQSPARSDHAEGSTLRQLPVLLSPLRFDI